VRHIEKKQYIFRRYTDTVARRLRDTSTAREREREREIDTKKNNAMKKPSEDEKEGGRADR